MANHKQWFPFDVGLYLKNTSRLTAEQHGCYLLLMLDYWESGPIPNNDDILARICRCNADAMHDALVVLESHFRLENNTWVHPVMEKMKSDQEAKYLKRKEAAKKRWSNEDAMHDAMHEQGESTSISTSNSLYVLKKEECEKAFSDFVQLAKRTGLSVPQRLTDTRKASLKNRLNECGGIEGWAHVLAKIEKSDFLSGRKTDFKADLDFVLQAKRFTKILEGGYDNHEPSDNEPDPTSRRRAILEGLGQSGPSGVGSSDGTPPGGDSNAPEGSGGRMQRGAESGNVAGICGANGSVVPIRGEFQHQDEPGATAQPNVNLHGNPGQAPNRPSGKGGQSDHRGVEVVELVT